MRNRYQNRLIESFTSLQKDLNEKKITQEQFNFLVGLLMQTQFNGFISQRIDAFLPENKEERQMTMVTYKLSRNLTYAGT